MTFIGIDESTGLFYEGGFAHGHAVWPIPVTAPARFVTASATDFAPPSSSHLIDIELLFREDSYDAVSRVRRGRFYQAHTTRPEVWEVFPHPYRPTEINDAKSGSGTLTKRLMTFQSSHVAELSIGAEQPLAIIGAGDNYAPWVVLGVETTSRSEQMVLLRARQQYGALPELKPEAIPDAGRAIVLSTIERLRSDVFRAGVESVVDRSRDVAAAALSTYLQSHKLARPALDLHNLISALRNVQDTDKTKRVAVAAAEIVRLFHARGKPSEQERLQFRTLREQDAELAIACVGAILCEFGWAEWT